MINKKVLNSIVLVLAAMIFMLMSIAGATPFAYITNVGSNTISVIDIAINKVIATVNVGNYPYGVAVTPDVTEAYVANYGDFNVSVIITSANKVTSIVNVGNYPFSLGMFIGGPVIPVANFSASSTEGHAPLTVNFIDKSTGSPTTRK